MLVKRKRIRVYSVTVREDGTDLGYCRTIYDYIDCKEKRTQLNANLHEYLYTTYPVMVDEVPWREIDLYDRTKFKFDVVDEYLKYESL